MAAHIAGNADDNRASLLPVLWLTAGLLLFPVALAGWGWMLVAKAAAPWRALGIAAVVVVVLVAVSGGKGYYAVGTMPVFMAAGAILLDRWLTRGHRRLRAAGFASAALISGALVASLTLPILPVATFATTTLPAQVPDTAEQIGWPEFVATVEDVVAALPADERARAMILTNEYGSASALELLGSGLPPVYSGHNAYWDWGPPPPDRTVVIHVGDWTSAEWGPVPRGLSHRGPHRQRARPREPGAGPGHLGLHAAQRVVDCRLAGAPAPRLTRERHDRSRSGLGRCHPGPGGSNAIDGRSRLGRRRRRRRLAEQQDQTGGHDRRPDPEYERGRGRDREGPVDRLDDRRDERFDGRAAGLGRRRQDGRAEVADAGQRFGRAAIRRSPRRPPAERRRRQLARQLARPASWRRSSR